MNKEKELIKNLIENWPEELRNSLVLVNDILDHKRIGDKGQGREIHLSGITLNKIEEKPSTYKRVYTGKFSKVEELIYLSR